MAIAEAAPAKFPRATPARLPAMKKTSRRSPCRWYSPPTAACSRTAFCAINVSRELFQIGGEDDHLARLAHTLARGADAGLVLQNEMDNAPLARAHGIKAERRVRCAHALRRDLR